MWGEAQLNDWERHAEQKTRDLLYRGLFKDALGVLLERGQWSPGSRLYVLEAQVQLGLDDIVSARGAVENGLQSAAESGNDATTFDLLLVRADIERRTRNFAQAERTLQEARSNAERLGDETRIKMVAAARATPGPFIVINEAGDQLLAIVTNQGQSKILASELDKAASLLVAAAPEVSGVEDSTRGKILDTVISAGQQVNAKNFLKGEVPEQREASLTLSAIGEQSEHPSVYTGPLVGFRKYQMLDVGWVQGLFKYVTSTRVPFPTHRELNVNPVHEIPSKVTLALAGAWATGTSYAPAVADRIRELQPDYTIHLGGVYYSGTPEEQQRNLIALWPAGQAGAFTLNSHHDMYSGGDGYFNSALKSETFKLQNGLSYFALENSH